MMMLKDDSEARSRRGGVPASARGARRQPRPSFHGRKQNTDPEEPAIIAVTIGVFLGEIGDDETHTPGGVMLAKHSPLTGILLPPGWSWICRFSIRRNQKIFSEKRSAFLHLS
jgi:hypothetical protein